MAYYSTSLYLNVTLFQRSSCSYFTDQSGVRTCSSFIICVRRSSGKHRCNSVRSNFRTLTDPTIPPPFPFYSLYLARRRRAHCLWHSERCRTLSRTEADPGYFASDPLGRRKRRELVGHFPPRHPQYTYLTSSMKERYYRE